MITEITDEQRAQMHDHVEKWISIGHQTGEANWSEWEAGARDCYKFAELEFPAIVVKVASPIAGAYISSALAYAAEHGVNIAETVPPGSLLLAWREKDELCLRIVPAGTPIWDPAKVGVPTMSGVLTGVAASTLIDAQHSS